MSKSLIIVFVKNLKLGKVKTRLAKSIGNEAALEVYRSLLQTTETATENLNCDRWVFYSENIDEGQWPRTTKFVQRGASLGEKMLQAFIEGFSQGYKSIVLIGSDLPDMTSSILNKAFTELEDKPVVFGPALDGGYYLIGLNTLIPELFSNKSWSTPQLLDETLKELKDLNVSYSYLEGLNDIDTYEDLLASGYLERHEELLNHITLLND